MAKPESHERGRYHHGDLRNALIQAGVALVREDGPDAIVLREAARRVGVTANAAYRHFDGLPDLVEAVRQEGFAALAASMKSQLAERRETGEPAADAIAALRAVGRGYVRFALAEPGLFTLAFNGRKHRPPAGDATGPADEPWQLLQGALDGLLAAGVLAPADREPAATNAWATVHGLSVLLLGPMSDVPTAAREQVIDDTLRLILRGLAVRPAG